MMMTICREVVCIFFERLVARELRFYWDFGLFIRGPRKITEFVFLKGSRWDDNKSRKSFFLLVFDESVCTRRSC